MPYKDATCNFDTYAYYRVWRDPERLFLLFTFALPSRNFADSEYDEF